MLIDRLKKGIWCQLLGATTAAADQRSSDRDVNDYRMSWLKRGGEAQSTISRLQDAPSWMNPMLVLTTARAASGV